MLLGLYRKLFPLVCALEPECLALGALIHIRHTPAFDFIAEGVRAYLNGRNFGNVEVSMILEVAK